MELSPKNKCDNCQMILKNNNIFYDLYKKDKHYLFCKKCLKILEICSKSKCKKIFLLEDNDLKNLKIIFLNNNQQFFVYEDIKQIVLNKYGSFKKLEFLGHYLLIEIFFYI